MDKNEKNVAVTAHELVNDPQRAHEIYKRQAKPVRVKTKRGDEYARFIPETDYKPDPARPAVKISEAVFNDQLQRFINAPSLGLTVVVEAERVPHFALVPPKKYRDGVTPESLNCWWVQERQPSSGDQKSSCALDITTVLVDLVARWGGIGGKLDKMGTDLTDITARLRALENRLDKLGVQKSRRRRKRKRKTGDAPTGAV